MKINRITEVGVAVRDLEKAGQVMVDLLGAEAGEVITMDMFQMRYRMCRVGQVDFELMEPIDGQGVIADFIEKRGEGIHHVAFAVENLQEGMRTLEEKGAQFVSNSPISIMGIGRDMAGEEIVGESKVNFTIPSSIIGILFEFIQYPSDCQF